MSLKKDKFIETLRSTKIISVIRLSRGTDMIPIMESLYKGGVKIIEITSSTPNYIESIKSLKGYFSDIPDCYIGAGTILTLEQMNTATAAGADFIVSPYFNEQIVRECVSQDIPVLPGCMTPTEIVHAWNLGSTVIKTFPGRICTPEFYVDIRGPLPMIDMMPTGNVNQTTAVEYIKAGAIAVGIGKALAGEELIIRKDWASIEKNAKYYSTLVNQ